MMVICPCVNQLPTALADCGSRQFIAARYARLRSEAGSKPIICWESRIEADNLRRGEQSLECGRKAAVFFNIAINFSASLHCGV